MQQGLPREAEAAAACHSPQETVLCKISLPLTLESLRCILVAQHLQKLRQAAHTCRLVLVAADLHESALRVASCWKEWRSLPGMPHLEGLWLAIASHTSSLTESLDATSVPDSSESPTGIPPVVDWPPSLPPLPPNVDVSTFVAHSFPALAHALRQPRPVQPPHREHEVLLRAYEAEVAAAARRFGVLSDDCCIPSRLASQASAAAVRTALERSGYLSSSRQTYVNVQRYFETGASENARPAARERLPTLGRLFVEEREGADHASLVSSAEEHHETDTSTAPTPTPRPTAEFCEVCFAHATAARGGRVLSVAPSRRAVALHRIRLCVGILGFSDTYLPVFVSHASLTSAALGEPSPLSSPTGGAASPTTPDGKPCSSQSPSDRIRLVQSRVEDSLASKFPELDARQLHSVALQVAQSAVKFAVLSVAPSQPLHLDLCRLAQLQDRAGAFVLYNAARLRSVLSMHARAVDSGSLPRLPDLASVDFSPLTAPADWELLLHHVLQFPAAVSRAARPDFRAGSAHFPTHSLPRFIVSFAAAISRYYTSLRFLAGSQEEMVPRLHFVRCLLIVLERALGFLGIDAVDML